MLVVQTEAAAVVVTVFIAVGIAAALDLGKNCRINVLVLVIAGHIVRGCADFPNHTVDLFFGDGDDLGAGYHRYPCL